MDYVISHDLAIRARCPIDRFEDILESITTGLRSNGLHAMDENGTEGLIRPEGGELIFVPEPQEEDSHEENSDADASDFLSSLGIKHEPSAEQNPERVEGEGETLCMFDDPNFYQKLHKELVLKAIYKNVSQDVFMPFAIGILINAIDDGALNPPGMPENPCVSIKAFHAACIYQRMMDHTCEPVKK